MWTNIQPNKLNHCAQWSRNLTQEKRAVRELLCSPEVFSSFFMFEAHYCFATDRAYTCTMNGRKLLREYRPYLTICFTKIQLLNMLQPFTSRLGCHSFFTWALYQRLLSIIHFQRAYPYLYRNPNSAIIILAESTPVCTNLIIVTTIPKHLHNDHEVSSLNRAILSAPMYVDACVRASVRRACERTCRSSYNKCGTYCSAEQQYQPIALATAKCQSIQPAGAAYSATVPSAYAKRRSMVL